jgi:hypothetical protein
MFDRSAFLIGCAVAAALSLPALAASPVLVTVTGAVEKANRGPMDPDVDKLFLFTGGEFEAAHALTLEALQALPQTTVSTDFPKGGSVVEFTGPTLEAVLEAAGAEGATVTVQALDGYAVEVPRAEMVGNGAILALALDGEPLSIGGMGPAMIAFPRAERENLADMPDDWWVWQIFHIKVE